MSHTPPPLSRIPWPPILYLSFAVAAWLANSWYTVALPNVWVFGAVLAISGISLDLWAALSFRKHQTTIMPTGNAAHLITTGPFTITRNPIYVGNTLLLSGLAFYFQNAWMLAAAFMAAYLTQKLAIEREEKYLAVKFGEAWKNYTAKTPRWLLFRS